MPWHHQTQAWWKRFWSSEMSPEYLESDLDRLFIAAALIDSFWWDGGVDLKKAAEIRQQLAPFGTSPLDRRKLDWTLDPRDEDEDGETPPEVPQPTGTDARSILRAVK